MMPKLTVEILKREAQEFSRVEFGHKEKSLFGITDSEIVDAYLKHKFKERLKNKYNFEEGGFANETDTPGLQVDIRFTDIYRPYSSYPFKSIRQKVYGLGHSLLWFMYEKTDDTKSKNSALNILRTLYMNQDRTADFQTTKGLTYILENDGNKDDLMAFMFDSYLLTDENQASELASEILANPPKLGYVRISNSLNRERQYLKAIEHANREKDIDILLKVG